MAGAEHWDDAYSARGLDGVSWYQAVPAVSLELVEELRVSPGGAVLDVGGGGSFLADQLLERGFDDITVLDVSETALAAIRARLPAGASVRCIRTDLLEWEPDRRYDLWHDRAVFHFLVDASERALYLEKLTAGVAPGGGVILGTFAADGPPTCSGLPVRRYAADELAAALGERFEVVATRREVHTTPRGALQPFTWVAGNLG